MLYLLTRAFEIYGNCAVNIVLIEFYIEKYQKLNMGGIKSGW